MTPAELQQLLEQHVTVDVPTAGRAFGMGRAKSYALARSGDFPVPVLTLGSRRRVRTADIAADLGHHMNEPAPAATGTGSTTTHPHQELEDRVDHSTPLRAVRA